MSPCKFGCQQLISEANHTHLCGLSWYKIIDNCIVKEKYRIMIKNIEYSTHYGTFNFSTYMASYISEIISHIQHTVNLVSLNFVFHTLTYVITCKVNIVQHKYDHQEGTEQHVDVNGYTDAYKKYTMFLQIIIHIYAIMTRCTLRQHLIISFHLLVLHSWKVGWEVWPVG